MPANILSYTKWLGAEVGIGAWTSCSAPWPQKGCRCVEGWSHRSETGSRMTSRKGRGVVATGLNWSEVNTFLR